MVPVGRAAKPLLSGRVPTADGNPDFDLSTGQEPESYSAMNPYRAITEGNEETTMGKLDGKVVQASPEFESCKKLAELTNVPLKEIYLAASRELKLQP